MNKTISTTLGFLLFIIGMMAVVLSLVGVQLSFLVWLDSIGPLFGFLAKIFMVLGGIVIVVLAQTDWKQEQSA